MKNKSEILLGPNGERLERTGKTRYAKKDEFYLWRGKVMRAFRDHGSWNTPVEILRLIPPPHESRSAREIALDLVEWQMATGKFLTAGNSQKAPVIPVDVLERAIIAADSSFAQAGIVTMPIIQRDKLREEFRCDPEEHELEWDGTDLDTIESEYTCHWCNYREMRP
jgi:hypothetical protein